MTAVQLLFTAQRTQLKALGVLAGSIFQRCLAKATFVCDFVSLVFFAALAQVVGRRLAATAEYFVAFGALHSADAHVNRSRIRNGIALFVFVSKVYSSLVNAKQVAAEALLDAHIKISKLFNFPVIEFLPLLLR